MYDGLDNLHFPYIIIASKTMIMNMNELKDMYNVQCKLYLIDIHVLEFCKLNLMLNFFLNQTLCL